MIGLRYRPLGLHARHVPLLAHDDDFAGDAWAAIRGELGAGIQKAFRLRKDLTVRPFTSFRSIDLENVRGIQCLLAPESDTAPFVQTCGVWRATSWLDATLGEAWPTSAGGL